MGLRVLITNMSMAARSGSETYVRDLALGLLARGHTPVVYSTYLGAPAQELRAATVMVVDDLRALGAPPDLIHGQHHPETVTALLHFPEAPCLFFCHGRLAERDAPPLLPRVRRYVAVDDACRDRLLFEHGIPESRLRVVRNAVDLARFRHRPPLPDRPRRALVFSHYASEHTHWPAVREACARAGVAVDVVGLSAGRTCDRPEDVLGGYDLVFAKGRCALEAAVVGCAVILCDANGMGPLVTASELDRLRRGNFGMRVLDTPSTPGRLLDEMSRYDPADAAAVSRALRECAGLDIAVESILALYEEVLEEHRRLPRPDPSTERAAFADYLRRLTSVRDMCFFHEEAREARDERDRCRAELLQLRRDLDKVLADRERMRAGWAALQTEYELTRRELDARRSELQRMRQQPASPGGGAPRRPPGLTWFMAWLRRLTIEG